MKGQSLMEVLIALSIIAFVASAVGGVIVSSLNNAQFGKNKTLATKYAQEGLEAIRELRNKNYTVFKAYSGEYCLGTIPATLTSRPPDCNTPNVANFIRTVEIEQSPGCGASLAKVMIKVAWSDGKCPAANPYCHTNLHSSCLSTVNLIQAP